MKKSTRTLGIVLSAGSLVAVSLALSAHNASKAAPFPSGIFALPGQTEPKPPIVEPVVISDDKIQIAILLDTSSSMDGLIDQAKSQLWKIVNEFASARRAGKRPRLEIALYEYGKSSLSADSGYIRQIVPFTSDLDKVSEELFALVTNGGDEYCGQVIDTAARELAWSARKEDLKFIFIAGNEPFTQGPVDWHKAIAGAQEKGIRVNAIHCGGDDASWKDAALLAKGEYMAIDHNRAVVHIPAPQDDELAKLGVELNGTYVAYGAHGAEGRARQEAQDRNAETAAPGSMTQRARAKSSSFYRNSSWDFVDATVDGTVDIATVSEEDLPPELKGMSPAQRKAYVDAMLAKRAGLQKRIAELSAERDKFVAEEAKKRGLDGENTFDVAMIKVVHDQAAAAGWNF